jgi:hypothetical protein
MKISRGIFTAFRKPGRRPEPPAVAELRGEALFQRVFKHPARSTLLKINGLKLPARAYHINHSAARELGISPAQLRGGAEVHIVSAADFERYCQSVGAKADEVAGVYAPAGSREIREVMAARKQVLPFGVRRALVPDDAGALTLVHEILHDLFNSWNLSDPHAERYGFCRLTVSEVYQTFLRARFSPAAQFFRGVAARCAEPYDLNRLLAVPVPQFLARGRRAAFSERTQAFIGEVFAYGGSMAIFSRSGAPQAEKEMGEVPGELMTYFERTIIHPDLV